MIFLAFTVTSGALRAARFRGPGTCVVEARRTVANRFVPWVTQAPAVSGPTRRPAIRTPPVRRDRCAGGALLPRQQVLARRPEGQVRVQPLAQVQQLQLLGEQPG